MAFPFSMFNITHLAAVRKENLILLKTIIYVIPKHCSTRIYFGRTCMFHLFWLYVHFTVVDFWFPFVFLAIMQNCLRNPILKMHIIENSLRVRMISSESA